MEAPAHVNEEEHKLQVRATGQILPDLGYERWVLKGKTSLLLLWPVSTREGKDK
jgi:hypothetical protein